MSYKPTRVDATQMDGLASHPFDTGNAGIWIKASNGDLYFHDSDGVDHNITTGGSGGSVGLEGAYGNSLTADDNIIAATTGNGPVLIRDNATPIDPFFAAQNSDGAINYLQASSLKTGMTGLTDIGAGGGFLSKPYFAIEDSTPATAPIPSRASPALVFKPRIWNYASTDTGLNAGIWATGAAGSVAQSSIRFGNSEAGNDLYEHFEMYMDGGYSAFSPGVTGAALGNVLTGHYWGYALIGTVYGQPVASANLTLNSNVTGTPGNIVFADGAVGTIGHINASEFVALGAISGSNLSGSNTGDQTLASAYAFGNSTILLSNASGGIGIKDDPSPAGVAFLLERNNTDPLFYVDDTGPGILLGLDVHIGQNFYGPSGSNVFDYSTCSGDFKTSTGVFTSNASSNILKADLTFAHGSAGTDRIFSIEPQTSGVATGQLIFKSQEGSGGQAGGNLNFYAGTSNAQNGSMYFGSGSGSTKGDLHLGQSSYGFQDMFINCLGQMTIATASGDKVTIGQTDGGNEIDIQALFNGDMRLNRVTDHKIYIRQAASGDGKALTVQSAKGSVVGGEGGILNLLSGDGTTAGGAGTVNLDTGVPIAGQDGVVNLAVTNATKLNLGKSASLIGLYGVTPVARQSASGVLVLSDLVTLLINTGIISS